MFVGSIVTAGARASQAEGIGNLEEDINAIV